MDEELGCASHGRRYMSWFVDVNRDQEEQRIKVAGVGMWLELNQLRVT